MNRTIKLLMLSDIFALTGFGLIEPILAIFIKENLVGGTIFAAGVASTLFLVTKSIVQLPFSRYVDNHDHNAWWILAGMAITSSVPFIYIVSTTIDTIYIAQIILGIGAGLTYPTWLGLWSTHLDRDHESYEWSLYSTLTGLGTAVSAAVGGAIAQFAGFTATFTIVGLMSLTGMGILLFLDKRHKRLTPIFPVAHHKRRKLGYQMKT
ncbi:MAG TPA: MFS transporter [Candidatus Nanoarchaeia archaeon]|nr:MFS transporter [Candidatus Nanoarchaeia archaeon]